MFEALFINAHIGQSTRQFAMKSGQPRKAQKSKDCAQAQEKFKETAGEEHPMLSLISTVSKSLHSDDILKIELGPCQPPCTSTPSTQWDPLKHKNANAHALLLGKLRETLVPTEYRKLATNPMFQTDLGRSSWRKLFRVLRLQCQGKVYC